MEAATHTAGYADEQLEQPLRPDEVVSAVTQLEAVKKMTRDIKSGLLTLTPREARFLVDMYYTMQRYRTRAGNQIKAAEKSEEPAETVQWFFSQALMLENEVKRALGSWSLTTEAGKWANSVCGIGPVIAAGLMAHIDIRQAPTVGHIWAFAGMNPEAKWDKGKKRPWNAALKVLCWKIGESFIKNKSREACVYGHLYDSRKEYEQKKNERGEYAEQAAAALAAKKFRDDTKAKGIYLEGKLPPGHIHARARRYCTKLFIAHYHEVAFTAEFGEAPPSPYPIAILGHAHEIKRKG